MLKRFGSTTRFLLGMAGILLLLLATTGAWWCLPAWPLASLPTEEGTCYHIFISPNRQTLIGVYEKSLAVWDLGRRQVVAVTPYDWGEEVEWPKLTPDIRLAPDGQTVSLARDNRLGPPPQVRLWHFATQPQPIPLPDLNGVMEFTADSKYLIVDHGDSKKLWDIATATVQEGDWPLEYLGYRLPDGRTIVIESDSEEGWLINQHWTKVRTISADLKTVSEPTVLCGVEKGATPSPDGRLLATIQEDGQGYWLGKLFDVRTGLELASINDRMNNMPYFSPDGSRLITIFGWTETIWDVTTMPPRRLGSVETKPTFSQDGRWMSLEHWYGKTKAELRVDWEILDAATLDKQGPTIYQAPILAPNGQSFAHVSLAEPSSIRKFIGLPESYSDRLSIQVCQLPGGRKIASFTRGKCFAYFPDGLTMAVGRDDDGTIEIWDIPPRRPWWIEYGLPVLFTLLLFLACRHCLRFRQKIAQATAESAPTGITTNAD